MFTSKFSGTLLSLFALVVLAACSPSSTPTPAPQAMSIVHPLSEILVGGPQFTDAQSNSITLQIDTRVPVVCAVSYGTTTTYGQLATSDLVMCDRIVVATNHRAGDGG